MNVAKLKIVHAGLSQLSNVVDNHVVNDLVTKVDAVKGSNTSRLVTKIQYD